MYVYYAVNIGAIFSRLTSHDIEPTENERVVGPSRAKLSVGGYIFYFKWACERQLDGSAPRASERASEQDIREEEEE